jgi:hypothetical protein
VGANRHRDALNHARAVDLESGWHGTGDDRPDVRTRPPGC